MLLIVQLSNVASKAQFNIKGHREIVETFVVDRADINTHGGEYGNAMQATAVNVKGDCEIVEMLVAKGVDINMHSGDYRNSAACGLA